MDRQTKVFFLLAIAGLAVFFAFVCRHRFIDGDEGAFLIASRLVLAHRKPYIDFFYQQAPLLPYVYGGWMKAAGVSWNSGRMLCLVLSVFLGAILFRCVWEETRSGSAAATAVFLFASSTLVFAWFSVVKTHCLTALLLLAAYALISRPAKGFRAVSVMAAGGLLALSIDTRSYILLLLPVFFVWILQQSDADRRRRTIGWFLLGFLVGILPSVWLLLSAPDAFVFNNLRYHALRYGNAGLIGWWQQKALVAFELFLGGTEANGLQWSMLFFVSFGFLVVLPRKSPAILAFYIALLLAAICLLPTPSYLQYFSVCMPFLIVTAVAGTSNLFRSLESRHWRRLFAGSVFIAVAGYVGLGCYDLRKYVVTGDGVPGVYAANDRADWRIDRVVQVSEAVDKITRPGEVVASFWSGDIFQTHAEPAEGLENPFSLTVAQKLTAEQRLTYHIVTLQQIEAGLARNWPRVVVLRDQLSSAFARNQVAQSKRWVDELSNLLMTHGYTLSHKFGDISVFVCPAR